MPTMAKKRDKTLDVTVVGLVYRITKPMLRELAKQTPFSIELERELDNIHDENAIAVVAVGDELEFQGRIGYLRRQVAADIAPRWDYGDLEILGGQVDSIDAEEGVADATITVRVKGKSLEIDT